MYNPAEVNHNMNITDSVALPQVVCPKQRTNMQISSAQTVYSHVQGTIPSYDNTQMLPRVSTTSQRHSAEPVPGRVSQATALVSHATVLYDDSQNDHSQSDIVKIMQKQNEITSLLVQQNLSSSLPVRQIPVFDGDPLEYFAFMRAFENGVEMKTTLMTACTSLNNTPGVIQRIWCIAVSTCLLNRDMKGQKIF